MKRISIGDKTYRVEIADTDELRKKGLQNRDFLPADEGMLFIWDKEGTREMWMKDTKIPLDQIAINDDDEVTMVYPAEPENESLVMFPNTKYILEVNQHSGIQIGDDFEIDEKTDLNKYVMKVLAPDGSTQMLLQGGERIVSRKETRTLIKKAKKAESVKGDNDAFDRACKSLGKYAFKVFYGQDHRNPQYVQAPN